MTLIPAFYAAYSRSFVFLRLANHYWVCRRDHLSRIFQSRYRIFPALGGGFLRHFCQPIEVVHYLCASLIWLLNGIFTRSNGGYELTVWTNIFKKSHADSA